MAPATWPPDRRRDRRLLVIDGARGAYVESRYADLARWLEPGDVLVLNDAATLPAALRGHVAPASASASPAAFVEARLAGRRVDGTWDAVLLGEGDARARTEERAPPPAVREGARLVFGSLAANVVAIGPSPRRVVLAFEDDGAVLWAKLYREARPVQYAYVRAPLPLWHVQTAYASRPWAVEAPSAGLGLDGDALVSLRRRGVEVARVTHAAGLSSTGDAALDASMPWPERASIPQATVDAVARARASGRRVVAMGTTVVRALEGAAAAGRLAAGERTIDLRLHAGSRRRVVDALVTGMHDPGASHLDLVAAFVRPSLLREAYAFAEARGFLAHELGDASLVIA